MRNTGSDAPGTIRFRCPSCGEDTIRTVQWCSRHASLPCDDCGGFIDLTSEDNQRAIEAARQALKRIASKD